MFYDYDYDCTRPKYSIHYEGYIFDGDSDGWNHHDEDDWQNVSWMMNAYPDIYVEDNEYGVVWHQGEWS